MNNLNSILIEGNLVKDPEVKQSPKGHAICTFVLATNRTYKQGSDLVKEVSYFNITTWSKEAERCGLHLRKGRSVRALGRLKQDRWTDAQGNKRSRIHIVADHIEFGYPAKDETSIFPDLAE